MTLSDISTTPLPLWKAHSPRLSLSLTPHTWLTPDHLSSHDHHQVLHLLSSSPILQKAFLGHVVHLEMLIQPKTHLGEMDSGRRPVQALEVSHLDREFQGSEK